MKNNFILLFLITVLPLSILLFLFVNYFWGKGVLQSFFIGFIIMSFIAFLSVFVIKKTFNKSFNIFWGFLAGSFFFRLIILLGSCYYFLKHTGINIVAYFISLMIYYFSYLIIEIIYYNYNFASIRAVKKSMKTNK